MSGGWFSTLLHSCNHSCVTHLQRTGCQWNWLIKRQVYGRKHGIADQWCSTELVISSSRTLDTIFDRVCSCWYKLHGCGSFISMSAKCSTLTCSMLLTLSSAVGQPTAVNSKEFQLETHQMSMHHLKRYLYNSKKWVFWLPILCQTVCKHTKSC